MRMFKLVTTMPDLLPHPSADSCTTSSAEPPPFSGQQADNRRSESPPLLTTEAAFYQQQRAFEEAAAAAARDYDPDGPRSLAGIALRSFCLGLAAALGLSLSAYLLLAARPSAPRLGRLPLFLAALAAFHFLEFWTTARYNAPAAKVSSFLLRANWPGYAVAHAAAALECLLVALVWPARDLAAPLLPGAGPLLVAAGVLLVLVGQAVRSLAMAEAGRSFNHIVQQQKRDSHVLVTSGVYAYLRHPSYFGFFWWALGTQLVLGNVVCFCAYAAVLWRFFSARIRHEEEFLVRFFGDDYVQYRRRVSVGIPFI